MTNSADGRNSRLGAGGFSVPGGLEAQTFGRVRFLEAVHFVEPRVLGSLYKHAGSQDDGTFFSEVVPEKTLAAWAARWHLVDAWCVIVATDTVHMWQSPTGDIFREEVPALRDQLDRLQWMYPVAVEAHLLDDDEEDIGSLDDSFRWSPKLETRQHAEMRMRQAFMNHLRREMNRIQETAMERGMDRVTILGAEQFEWLARYQVGTKPDGRQWSQSDLATKYAKDPATIREALQSRASFIGLTLREPGKPGRRPKGSCPHASGHKVIRSLVGYSERSGKR
jgi:hypothetical protein